MENHLQRIIMELHASSYSGVELEEKEAAILQELRLTEAPAAFEQFIAALAVSGTILAVPCLCAVLKNRPGETGLLAEHAILRIKERARKRSSMLPDAYFTPQHWQPEWRGSKNSFLSYVSALANILIKSSDNNTEVNRIGELLVSEMRINISPFNTFEQYRICAVNWDFKEDYRLILERIEQESILASIQETGIAESWNTFLSDNIMDLQYDYLLTRLRMAENFEYNKFVMKIAECLNQPGD